MKNSFFNIKTPCSESWDNMLPNEEGKFCVKCDLNVVDFTCATSKEIDDYLNIKKNERVCGRISVSKPKRVMRRAAIGLAIVSLTWPTYGFNWDAQPQTLPSFTLVQNSFGVIQGEIKDAETEELLPFVKITTTVDGKMYGCMSDFDGRYKLQIPNMTNPSDTFLVNFSHLDYDTIQQSVVVKSNHVSFLNVSMNSDIEDISIGIIVREPIIDINGNPFEHKITEPFKRNKDK